MDVWHSYRVARETSLWVLMTLLVEKGRNHCDEVFSLRVGDPKLPGSVGQVRILIAFDSRMVVFE